MKNKEKKVWVLTSEHNDYDQHGTYFLAVWENKPDLAQLAEYFAAERIAIGSTIAEGVVFLTHLQNGGGRKATESVWYHLTEEVLR
jgi:hypothetical protein